MRPLAAGCHHHHRSHHRHHHHRRRSHRHRSHHSQGPHGPVCPRGAHLHRQRHCQGHRGAQDGQPRRLQRPRGWTWRALWRCGCLWGVWGVVLPDLVPVEQHTTTQSTSTSCGTGAARLPLTPDTGQTDDTGPSGGREDVAGGTTGTKRRARVWRQLLFPWPKVCNPPALTFFCQDHMTSFGTARWRKRRQRWQFSVMQSEYHAGDVPQCARSVVVPWTRCSVTAYAL